MLQKLKAAYLLWFGHYAKLPKAHRFTLGSRIDDLLIQMIEAIAAANFAPIPERILFIKHAMKKLDTVKILLQILWETHSFDDKKYIAISEPLNEVGRNLGGWLGKLVKENSPANAAGEK